MVLERVNTRLWSVNDVIAVLDCAEPCNLSTSVRGIFLAFTGCTGRPVEQEGVVAMLSVWYHTTM